MPYTECAHAITSYPISTPQITTNGTPLNDAYIR